MERMNLNRILVHPLWGSLIFFAFFYLIFHIVFAWTHPLMEGMNFIIIQFSLWGKAHISNEIVRGLLFDGIVAGVGSVVIFMPQIFLLFWFLSILEQSGYMGRVAMLSHKVMLFFGLSGRAFLPYVAGFGCTVPAVMAAQAIPDRRERMAVILTVPFVSCSGRLPAYVLLVATIIPSQNVLFFLNSQALAFFILYFGGTLLALIAAKLFRLSFFKGKSDSSYYKLAELKIPSIKRASQVSLKNARAFIQKAGTFILVLSILFWFASSYPKSSESSSVQLEQSYMGRTGKIIAPVLAPLGVDWKIAVALLMSFGARELFVSSLGTIYAVQGADEDSVTLQKHLFNDYGTPALASVLAFFALACQCVGTFAIVRKEAGGHKWGFFLFSYTFVLAYIGALITKAICSL